MIGIQPNPLDLPNDPQEHAVNKSSGLSYDPATRAVGSAEPAMAGPAIATAELVVGSAAEFVPAATALTPWMRTAAAGPEALGWSSKIAEALSTVSEGISTTTGPLRPLLLLMGEFTNLIGCHAAAVFRYEQERRLLRLVCGHVDGQTSLELSGHPFGRSDSPVSVDDFPAWPDLLKSGRRQFLAMPVESTAPPSNEWHAHHRHRSIIQSALLTAGKPIGLLGLAFQSDLSPNLAQLEAFDALAVQVTMFLQQIELAERERQAALAVEREAAMRERAAELTRASEALQTTIDAVAELASLNDFVPRALHIVADAFGAGSAAFYEHPNETIFLRYWLLNGDVFGPRDLPGLDRERYAMMTRLADGFTVLETHLGVDLHHRSRPSIIHHASATASPQLHQFAMSMGWEWELNVPLVIGDRAEGAMTLYRAHGRPFTEADFSLAETLAKQMALAMNISGLAQREREAESARVIALERLRIAAEMHDSLAQSFTSIALQSESLRSRKSPDSSAAATLLVIEQTARQGLAEVRASVLTLHSLEGPPGTLDKALAQLATRCNVPGSIRCDFIHSGEPCEVSCDVRESLMRIAREGLSNAMRHSRGTRMLLTIAYAGGQVQLSVEDDGTGVLDTAWYGRPGFGLEGMSRRAEMIGAILQFGKSPLGGALISIEVPCAVSPSAPWAR